MSTVIISCRVKMRNDGWRRRSATRCSWRFGLTEVRTFVGVLDPTQVALVVEASPPDPGEEAADLRVLFASMAEHPAVLEVLAVDGVVPGSLEYLLER